MNVFTILLCVYYTVMYAYLMQAEFVPRLWRTRDVHNVMFDKSGAEILSASTVPQISMGIFRTILILQKSFKSDCVCTE